MSEIKVNKLSPRTNCGTVQLGDSGDTITIPAGATITNNGTAAGFGATGAASWDTTVKTSGFTAVSGVGYFVNTTAGAISVNLPAGTAGDVVAIKDYANTFDTNAVTLTRNGSDKIGGQAINATLSTEGIAVTLVFIDSTQGWLVTDSGLQSEATAPGYITATGGTITCCGDYKVHTFTGPGNFTVTCAGNSGGSNTVDYLVVAGGGGGGSGWNNNSTGAAGAGAGGFRLSASTYSCGSPLASPTNLSVSATTYPITVGGGGTAGTGPSSPLAGGTGSNSVFSTITSAGGGYGATGFAPPACLQCGGPGGSGGGGAGSCSQGTGSVDPASAGTGNTPPVSPPQGNNGGGRIDCNAASGGGAGASGGNAKSPGSSPGAAIADPGGIGSYIPDSALGPTAPSYGTPGPVGSTRYFAGGGGAGASLYTTSTGATGGSGGGGAGGNYPSGNGNAGTTNTGGGGGGSGTNACAVGGAGGSGIVIIRYKFQN